MMMLNDFKIACLAGLAALVIMTVYGIVTLHYLMKAAGHQTPKPETQNPGPETQLLNHSTTQLL